MSLGMITAEMPGVAWGDVPMQRQCDQSHVSLLESRMDQIACEATYPKRNLIATRLSESSSVGSCGKRALGLMRPRRHTCVANPGGASDRRSCAGSRQGAVDYRGANESCGAPSAADTESSSYKPAVFNTR